MPKYNPRNRNRRYDDAPLSWSQKFYDSRGNREPRKPCGFSVPEGRDK